MNDAMSTRHDHLSAYCPREVCEHNKRLDEYFRERFGVTLFTWKSIKALWQLAAVGLAFYAISEGAAPFPTFALLVVLLVGPDAFEYIAIGDNGLTFATDARDQSDDRDPP